MMYDMMYDILGNAVRMIEERQNSDSIFIRCFYSSEGYYSQLVFKDKISVKIIGRGFDDFSTTPVIVHRGMMMRCNIGIDLLTCLNITRGVNADINSIDGDNNGKRHKQLSSSELFPVNAVYNAEACIMFWLPIETRYW